MNLKHALRYIEASSAVFTLSLLSCTAVLANPQGPQVAHGQVEFSRPDPSTLNVTNSPNAIVNWESFSIGADEATRFIQEGAHSAILNRVTGQDPSAILGQLMSNGRVFLINANGMIFGPDSVIDTAGFVASTLNITDEDFLAGNLNFEGGPDAGTIENQGLIQTRDDGGIYLIAPNIENSGIIRTEGGNLLLAAGQKLTISSLDVDHIQFEIQAPENEVVNLGQLLTSGGAMGMFAGTIRNHGVVEADSVSMDEQGNIQLVAQADIDIEPESRITASGPQGGNIHIESETGTTLVSGTIEAKGSEEVGGEVHVLGERVGLVDKASIDVSGQRGGGTALVGGDYKGQGEVKNAEMTYVGPGVSIKADAVSEGDGGEVMVWANDTTRYYGNISARGGADSGDGGFVEVSGKKNMDFNGSVDTHASNGEAGTLLLDPTDIAISNADSTDGVDADLPDIFEADFSGAAISVNAAMLEAQGGNIVLQAEQDIAVLAALNLANQTSGESVVFQAGRNITVNENITTQGADVHFEADSPHILGGADGTGTLSIDAEVSTNGGDITNISPGFSVTATSLIDAGSGNINNTTSLDGSTFSIQSANNPLDFAMRTDSTVIFGQATTAGDDGLGANALTLVAGDLQFSTEKQFNVSTLALVARNDVVVDEPLSNSGDLVIAAESQVDINADINTEGGAINIASGGIVDSTGRLLGGDISITSDDAINLSGFDDSVVGSSITIDTLGPLSVAGSLNTRSDGPVDAGDIIIGNTLAPSSITVDRLSARNRGGGGGGNISLTTPGSLNVTGAFLIDDGSNVDDPSDHPPNDIASIASEADGSGGSISVTASGGITTAAGIFTDSFTSGNGGSLTLTSNSGAISIGVVDTSSVDGTGGTIAFTSAGDINSGDISSTSVNGQGGGIDLGSSGTISTGVITLGSSSGLGGGSLIVNSPDPIDLTTGLTPNGADIIIGNTTRPSNVLLPENLLTDGGDLSVAISNSYTLTSNVSTTDGGVSIDSLGNLIVSVPIQTSGGDINLIGENVIVNPVTLNTGEGASLNLIANNGTLNFDDSTLITNELNLGAPVVGTTSLTLLPATNGQAIDIGSSTDTLMSSTNIDMLAGYSGVLFIGGGISRPVAAGNITVSTDFGITGDLTLVSLGDITVDTGGSLSSKGTLTLAALGQMDGTDGNISDPGMADKFFFDAPTVIFFANNESGSLENPLTVRSFGNTVRVGAGTGEAFFDGAPGNIVASDSTIQSAFDSFEGMGFTLNPNILNTRAVDLSGMLGEPQPKEAEDAEGQKPEVVPEGIAIETETQEVQWENSFVRKADFEQWMETGVEIPLEIDLSNFTIKPFLSRDWLLAIDYQMTQPGSVVLTISGKEITKFRLDLSGSTNDRKTTIVDLSAYYDHFPSDMGRAEINLTAKRDDNPEVSFPLRIFGMMAGTPLQFRKLFEDSALKDYGNGSYPITRVEFDGNRRISSVSSRRLTWADKPHSQDDATPRTISSLEKTTSNLSKSNFGYIEVPAQFRIATTIGVPSPEPDSEGVSMEDHRVCPTMLEDISFEPRLVLLSRNETAKYDFYTLVDFESIVVEFRKLDETGSKTVRVDWRIHKDVRQHTRISTIDDLPEPWDGRNLLNEPSVGTHQLSLKAQPQVGSWILCYGIS